MLKGQNSELDAEACYIVVVQLGQLKELWNKFSLRLNLVLILYIFQILLDFITTEHFVKPYDCSPELNSC